ncbi:MAG: transcriptional regulator [Nocardioides sp.]|nr:transcriptional regulator [Nocardioides sp.]
MEPDAGPTARALLALELLQGAALVPAPRLAERLGVSERAARRCVAVLRDAGIPVESVRGPHGGYRLGRGTRPRPLVLSSEEALGLVMAVLDGHHAAGVEDDPVGRALGTLLRALPQGTAETAESVRRTAAAAADRGAARPDPAVTATLVQAVSDRKRVRLWYVGARGPWETEVEPWAVVVRHGRWYLVCRDTQRDAVRTYRVDRVRAPRPVHRDLGGQFTPPTDVDPVDLLEQHLAEGWELEVEVRVAGPVEEVGRWLPRTLGRLDDDGAGGCVLTGSTSNPAMVAEALVRLPMPFRVVGAPEVRDALRVIGERARAAVADD